MTEDRPSGVVATAAQVAGGARSAVEVVQESLARADAYAAVQPEVWISRLSDEVALARAREVDGRVKRGETLPLAGVPFAVKDNIDVLGVETTVACPAFAYAPVADAVVIGRLIAAGAVPIGKTNLDQFATGLTGARSPYGALGNVFDRAFIAGGSSSGSAVAVAAGITPFALGSDTAGSGRVPAAFNGLVGVKPTRGRWSARGVFPACRSLDCVSVLTGDLADATVIDRVLGAFDQSDPYSRAAPAGPIASTGKIGVPRPQDLTWFGDGEAERLFKAAIRRARNLGADLEVVDVSPLLDCGKLLYDGPWIAERAAALGDFLRNQPGAIHPVVRAIVQAGANLSAVEAFEGFDALQSYKRAAEAVWLRIDALILPTAPTIYRIAEVLAEPFALNANLGLYTNFVNLLDMAALAVPVGFRSGGAGFGVSLIGPAWSDARLLDLAARFLPQEAARPDLDHAERPAKVKLAVVGAHLASMPLNWQLTSRGARLARACRTAPVYRLYAMADATPPKPALVHVGAEGAAVEVEVWEFDQAAFGGFVAEVSPPLAIGTIELEGGETVKGFVAEPRAIAGALDITHLGGWRAYIARI